MVLLTIQFSTAVLIGGGILTFVILVWYLTKSDYRTHIKRAERKRKKLIDSL